MINPIEKSQYNNTEARRKSDRREHIFKLATVGLSVILGHSFEVKVPVQKGKLKESIINISVVQTSLFEIPELPTSSTRSQQETYHAQIFNGISDFVVSDGRTCTQGKRKRTEKTVKMNTYYAIDPFNENGFEQFAVGMEKILTEQLPKKNVRGKNYTVDIEGHNQLIENLYTSLLTTENLTGTGSSMVYPSITHSNSQQQGEQLVPSDPQSYQEDLAEIPMIEEEVEEQNYTPIDYLYQPQYIISYPQDIYDIVLIPQPEEEFIEQQSQQSNSFTFEFTSNYIEDMEYCGFVPCTQF
jgi:hypothetical protein